MRQFTERIISELARRVDPHIYADSLGKTVTFIISDIRMARAARCGVFALRLTDRANNGAVIEQRDVMATTVTATTLSRFMQVSSE